MKCFPWIVVCFFWISASCECGGTPELSASFTYGPLPPVVGQAVQFSDTSTGNPTAWQWNFGDGTASTDKDPRHTYMTVASFTVTLTVSNRAGTKNTTRAVIALTGTVPPSTFPLKVSTNGRYLAGQDDKPFLMMGDCPQGGMVGLSVSDANYFFANRASYGINTVWINLLSGTTFGGRSDFSTYDGILPFTALNDYATPNPAYFSRVDAILDAAANNGIAVWLNPAETIDSLSVMLSNGINKCYDFGKYLGNRYKNFDNIVWAPGNDFQTWSDPSHTAVVHAVASGIKQTDSRHLHTVMLDGPISSSTDNGAWSDLLDFNSAYTYFPTYAEVVTDYDLSPTRPVIMCESCYEFENGADAERLRREIYWTFLSGGRGYIYGNGYVWPITSSWKSHLNTTGIAQLAYCRDLLQSRAWHTLAPDQAHTLVTAGFGTYSSGGTMYSSISTNDYATAARNTDGTLALIYVPTARTITIAMTAFSGPVNGRWYDPTTGTYQAIIGSPFLNVGSLAFSTPGTHSDGASDWVLVLEKQ